MGKQDLEIARTVTLKPIQEIGAAVGLTPAELEPYGHHKAKVSWHAIVRRRDHPDGTLVLVTAMLDHHLAHGSPLGLDTRRVLWKRVVDMNDRALRNIVLGLGGPAHGVPRQGGFEITVASEVMAILCLSADLVDFKTRAGHVVVAETAGGAPVTAADLRAAGAMAVLMKDAIKPNLVQTLEGTPALVHGG